MQSTTRRLLLRSALVVLLITLPAAAGAAESGFQGWGPRLGFASDPDQAIGGVHFDMGEIAPNFRWEPNLEIGFGDEVTSFSANVLFAYYFPNKSSVTPYAGGQLAAVFFDPDKGDSNTEIGADAVGGIETTFGSTRMFFELQLGFGDIHDAKIIAGWKF